MIRAGGEQLGIAQDDLQGLGEVVRRGVEDLPEVLVGALELAAEALDLGS